MAPTIIFLPSFAGLPGQSGESPGVLQGAEAPRGVGQCGHRPGAPQLDEGAVGTRPGEHQYLFKAIYFNVQGVPIQL